MDRDDLRAIIKIADYVIKEHPVWVEKTLDITEDKILELPEATNTPDL